MKIVLDEQEVLTIQLAFLRARSFTPRLPHADERAMNRLLERLLDEPPARPMKKETT